MRLFVLMGLVAFGLGCTTTEVAIDVPTPADESLLPEPVRAPIGEAIEHCRENPRDPQAFERLALIYHGNELTALAAECYGRAIALGSTAVRTRYLLGLIHRQSGHADAAVELLREAAALEPAYAPTHYNLGEALLDAGRIDAALVAFEKAIEIDGDDPVFHAALGRALRQAGRLERAEASLRRALELAPDDAEAHQLLGLTLQAMKRTDEAGPHLDRLRRRFDGVVTDPWLLEAQRHAATSTILLDRAGIYLDQDKLESALALLAQAAASYPDDAAVFRMIGKARLRAGETQMAVRAYVRATDLEPDDPEAHAALALILSNHGKVADARHEAELALAADPEHAMAVVVLAGLAIRRGEPQVAIETIRPVLERRDDLVAAHVVHGEALYETGALDRAAAAFARAVELDPESEYARRRLDETLQALAEPGVTP